MSRRFSELFVNNTYSFGSSWLSRCYFSDKISIFTKYPVFYRKLMLVSMCLESCWEVTEGMLPASPPYQFLNLRIWFYNLNQKVQNRYIEGSALAWTVFAFLLFPFPFPSLPLQWQIWFTIKNFLSICTATLNPKRLSWNWLFHFLLSSSSRAALRMPLPFAWQFSCSMQ